LLSILAEFIERLQDRNDATDQPTAPLARFLSAGILAA
jgi:hypothetical protein